MKKEVLLFTSGIDSYIAREYLIIKGHEIDCLYFDYGGRYCKVEIEKIKSLPFDVTISDRIFLGDIEHEDAHIPNRNIIFTVLAHALDYKKVWLGGSLSDRVGDNKPGVYVNLSRLLTEVNEEYCEIFSPFYHCYKDDMTSWFVNEKGDEGKEELLNNTFSCFQPISFSQNRVAYMMEELECKRIDFENPIQYETKECMLCCACFRKCAVMFSGGIFIPFRDKTIVNKYEDKFTSDIKPSIRAKQTLNYIDILKHFWVNKMLNNIRKM